MLCFGWAVSPHDAPSRRVGSPYLSVSFSDLNYRVNLSDSDIRTLLSYDHDRTANIPVLLEHDQVSVPSFLRCALLHSYDPLNTPRITSS